MFFKYIRSTVDLITLIVIVTEHSSSEETVKVFCINTGQLNLSYKLIPVLEFHFAFLGVFPYEQMKHMDYVISFRNPTPVVLKIDFAIPFLIAKKLLV